MSGVFGFISHNHTHNLNLISEKMIRSMSHLPWYENDSYEDAELGVLLGRLGIGIFNANKKGVWNKDKSMVAFLSGELYSKPDQNLKRYSDEEWALISYEKYGADFAKHLKGIFIIAILDRSQKKVIITNDRHGLYPTYYSSWGNFFSFAPEMKGVFSSADLPKTLDKVALAQYMRLQHLLGNRTFFENIQLLPNASYLIYDLQSHHFTIHPYWTFNDIKFQPEVKFNDAVEETGRLLRKSVTQLSNDRLRPGVFLSGGMDSRTILGLISRRPIISFNWGNKNCPDVRYSRMIAKTVGSEHHWFDLEKGDWVLNYIDLHLALTEGFHSWIHSHGISVLPVARNLIDVVLTGWDGGTVMGHMDNIDLMQINAVDWIALSSYLFNMFVRKYTWPSITEAEEKYLYHDSIAKEMQGLAFQSFVEELAPYENYRKDIRSELFYIMNHCRRMTIHMITTARSHIDVRVPFFDYDLFDFLFSIPAQVRGHQVLYRAVIQQEIPRLGLIPYDHDGLLPISNPYIRKPHAFFVKTIRRLNKQINPHFSQNLLYADYENYLRKELRAWGESILFGPHIKEHGIFNPKFIQSIWERHQSGLELWTIGKIAPIMTYEMMQDAFLH